jgi:hypothetical protein
VGRTIKVALAVSLVVAMGACVPFCGIGAKFSFSNAHVDSEY